MKIAYPLVAAVALVTFVSLTTHAEEILAHTFDTAQAGEGAIPDFSVFGEETMDKGITRKARASKPQSAYVVTDFSKDSWGSIMISFGGEWNMQDAMISVNVRADHNFESEQGVIGFKLIDSDGSEYRTDPIDLFKPTQKFQTFSQKLSDISLMTEAGSTPELNTESIFQFGILILDRDDYNKESVFYFDDIIVTR